MTNLNPCFSVSPVDGRYHEATKELGTIFSEFGLMKARLLVEVEYLILLVWYLENEGVKPFPKREITRLKALYENFNEADFAKIKAHEKVTGHDVKSVEYFLRDKLESLGLNYYAGYIHLGRTSEDINNVAMAIQLKYGTAVLINHYRDIVNILRSLAKENENVPMLALTHGQAASPSTIGWTMLVFKERLDTIIRERLNKFSMSVKLNGATGGDNALCVAYPNQNWRTFASTLIANVDMVSFENSIEADMDFRVNKFTFQIEPHDTYKELFEILTSLNTVLIDFAQDIWMYITLEYFVQKPVAGEVGSSAMPQKINPIQFENAEGNFGMANAMFEFFSRKLPISRMYRDLSDSTVERNFGTAFAHTLIALKALKKGLSRIHVNHAGLQEKLEQHWEVVSEAYQVILRAEGIEDGYELLLKEVRGKKVTKEILHSFVDKLTVSQNLKPETVKRLKEITPHNYVGNRSF